MTATAAETAATAATHLHLLRLTLEAESPIAIGSGAVALRRRKDPDTQATVDHKAAAVLRDANGLPVIPGPSLQGVLRRLAVQLHGPGWAEELLGVEEGDHAKGRAGRVIFGWGRVHDSQNRAADPRPGAPPTDPLLAFLAKDAPLWRDHVALGDRLSVEGAKKFARAPVPRGARFSVELALFGAEGDDRLVKLAALVRHPDFRLGAARNAGYGRVRLIAASHAALPLTDPGGIRATRSAPPSTALETDLLKAGDRFEAPEGASTVATITLTARDLIRFGGATEEAAAWTPGTHGVRKVADGRAPNTSNWTDDLRPAGENGSDPDNLLRVLTEPVILWEGARGKVLAPQEAQRIVRQRTAAGQGSNAIAALGFPVPGAQIKGTLAHRTLYHWNRAAGRTVDADAFATADATKKAAILATLAEAARRPEPLGRLLGQAKGPPVQGRGPSPGQAARLMVDDSRVEAECVVALDHISIDRFTGGVRNVEGVLFAEEALAGARLTLTLRIGHGPGTGGDTVNGWPEEVATAFLKALRDLCTGRLPLGARSLGACTGSIAWSGPGAEAWAARAQACGVPAAQGGRA